MTTTDKKRTHVCGICGVTLKDEKWIYSQHSNERYCTVPEWNACHERADARRGDKK